MTISSTGNAGQLSAWVGAGSAPSSARRSETLYNMIDTAGGGTITQEQFAAAFSSVSLPASVQAAGADALWSQLDPSGTGRVSKQDFISGMNTAMQSSRGGPPPPPARTAQAGGISEPVAGPSLLDLWTVTDKSTEEESGSTGNSLNFSA